MKSIATWGRGLLPLALVMLQACGGGGSDPDASAAPTMRAQALPAASAGTPVAAAAAGQRRRGGLAFNPSGVDYWTTEFPFIDQFKRAGTWITQADGEWDTGEEAQLDLDPQGWPRSLPASDDPHLKYRQVISLVLYGDQGAHPAGTYTVTYEGEGELDYVFNLPVRRGDHRDEVDIKTSDSLGIVIKRTSPDNPIRNVRVLPPGGVCSNARRVVVASASACGGGLGSFVSMEQLSTQQLFYPAYLAAAQGARQLRFMDWARTNDTTLANWADRPKKEDATWTGPYGVPLAVMVALANTLKLDPWINLPHQATDDYARQAGKFLKKQLAADAQVTIEYTNEAWNTFQQGSWIQAQANAAWAGKIANYDPFAGRLNWHAMRSAQLCGLIKAEFGSEAGRVKCVLGTQAANTWVGTTALDCSYAQSALGKPCGQLHDAVAIAPYFGVHIAQGRARQDYITSHWFTQSDGGLGSLFEEIRALDDQGQPVTPPMTLAGLNHGDELGGALAQSRIWMDNYRRDVTDKAYKLPIWAYEGGQHLVDLGPDCAEGDNACLAAYQTFRTRWIDLFIRANRDARMGLAYGTMMDDWKASGGQVFAAFSFIGAFSQYGAWGLKETLFTPDADSPKWLSLLPYRDGACWWSTQTRSCRD